MACTPDAGEYAFEAHEMRQKRVCENEATTLIPLKIFFRSKNEKIQNIIEKLNGTTDFTIQQECIKAFTEYIQEPIADEEKVFVLRLLAFLYIACVPKHPIKKTLGRILSLVKCVELLARQFSDSIRIQLNYVNKMDDPSKAVVFRDYFNSCMGSSLDLPAVVEAMCENINMVFNFALTFLSEVVNCLWGRKSPVISAIEQHQQRMYIYNATKFLLGLLQKCKVKNVNQHEKLKLITCCYDLIIHKHVAYDIKSNCGHIMVILFTCLPQKIVNKCTFKKYPYLEFLKFGKQPSPALEKLGLEVIKDEEIFETFKVCVYGGILIIASRDVLCELKLNDELILLTMFNEIIESAKRAKGNATQIMGIAKAVSVITMYLECLSLEEVLPLFKRGLDYTVVYLDDRIEIVRTFTKAVFENLVHLALSHSRQGKDVLLEIILQWLKDLPDCNTRYTGITVICSEIGCGFLLSDIPDLAKQLLAEMNHPSKVSTITACYETLMQTHMDEVESIDDWGQYWVNEIVEALKESEPPLTSYLQKLFISAFNFQPVSLKALTQKPYLNADKELGAFLGCIHSARKRGIQIPVEKLYKHPIDPYNSWRNLLEYKTLEILQTHQNDEIRIVVIAIIVDSQKTTEVFTAWEMQFLLKFLYYNISMSNSSKRQQIIGYAKKAMTRAKDSIAVVHRNMESLNDHAGDKPDDSARIRTRNRALDTSAYYNKFWEEMFNDVLLPGLYPDCNYGRRSACLELLLCAYHNLDRALFHKMWHKQDLTNLKYILQYDTYERNKDLAAQLLAIFSPDRLGFHTKELVQKHIDESLSLAVSIKPTLTISAAYMLKACFGAYDLHDAILERMSIVANLEELYDVKNNKDTVYLLLVCLILQLRNCYLAGEQNLQEAAASKPIHGFAFCIRYLLKTEYLSKKVESCRWRVLLQDLLHWCFQLNKLVKTIICNRSPEGYLPDDSDPDIRETDETARAQMVTVYGWRAAKEISLLLGEIVLRSTIFDDAHPEGLIDEQQIKLIGDYFFDLLVTTKHRGAFEQAAYGFSSFCYRLWRLPNTSINKLPAQWLKKILDIVLGFGEETVETCATRRSAGVPFMVQAILVTEPKTGNEQFHSCMKILLDVGGDVSKPDEQRIHCMNILRALYRHNQLGELVMSYCAQGMIISIGGFGSNIWGIRNSATLLFSTLMVRMFGVPRTRDSEAISNKNKMIAKIFFVRYPELYSFLLSELKKGAGEENYPSLFPILLVLSRLYCSTENSDVYQLGTFLPHIQACLANPVYRIRDLAAKTCINLIQPKEVPKYIILCLISLSDVSISNAYCHGILLHLQYLLQIPHDMPPLNLVKVIDGTAWILVCCNQQINHVTATLYVEVVMDLIARFDQGFDSCEIFKMVSMIIQWQAQNEGDFKIVWTALKKYRMQMFNLKLYLLLHVVKCHACYANFYQIATYQKLIQTDIHSHSVVRNMCISYITYLKFSASKYASHKLSEEDDSEHVELVNKYLKPLKLLCKRFLYELLYHALEKATMVKENEALFIHDVVEASFIRLFSLQCFPVLIKDKRLLLLHLVNFCNFSSDEQIVHTAIAYLDSFLRELTIEEILEFDLDGAFDTVLKYCSPIADVSYRLGMCKLLINNKRLFYQKTDLLNWGNLCMMWEAVFLLLEDDDEVVRNTICQLCEESLVSEENQYTFIPEKKLDIPEYAREMLLNTMVKTLPTQCSIDILLAWILRGKEVTGGNLSEVFDEGELNTYAEVYPVAKVATETLFKVLWTFEDEINFDDKSIFIEEQLLLVATVLYDKFIRNYVPLVTDRMNTALKNILARAILFLERVVVGQPDFEANFKKVFDNILASDVVEELDVSELIRLKMFLGKMFKMVL